MARYTVELKTIMEDPNLRPLLDKALSTYPMYKPQSDDPEVLALIPTREALNEKLLRHYKYKEIGQETIAQFLDYLEMTMCEIMPHYNQRFKTVEIMALIDDPFGNVDVTESYEETRTATGTTTGEGSATTTGNDQSTVNSSSEAGAKNVESDTPQGNIAKTASEIDDITHADKAAWSKTNTSDESTTQANTTSETSSSSESASQSNETISHTFTKKGNQGVNTYAHDMIEFRESIIDVTMEIIEDKRVRELFMLVY